MFEIFSFRISSYRMVLSSSAALNDILDSQDIRLRFEV